ncbi:hypothetical protein N8I77_008964 [Diaporthe amygdali]|uniref:Uncharacterized protein n=1 Tax=Phomopsis amygdali TaxID=1214568 RepID=A0AAD9W092_PHOAM|nr:hypothetical protein N8I77_008964 [Diaporthe amygdali]
MNTVKSFWLGWGSLCVAGAGAYVVAKRSINADRQARLEEQRKKKSMIESLEYSQNVPSHPGSASAMGGSRTRTEEETERLKREEPRVDHAFHPSLEQAAKDVHPTEQMSDKEYNRLYGKSKYESATPFRSRKGDRFSDI